MIFVTSCKTSLHVTLICHFPLHTSHDTDHSLYFQREISLLILFFSIHFALIGFCISGPFCALGSYSNYASIDAVVFIFGLGSQLAKLGTRYSWTAGFWCRMSLSMHALVLANDSAQGEAPGSQTVSFGNEVFSILFLLEAACVLGRVPVSFSLRSRKTISHSTT